MTLTRQATESVAHGTYIAGEDLRADRHVKFKSGTLTIPPEVVYADEGELGIGITRGDADSGKKVAVRFWTSQGEFKIIMAANCSVLDDLYSADDGKFSPVSAGNVIFKAVKTITGGDGSENIGVLSPVLSTTAGTVSYDNSGGETTEATLQAVLEEIYGHLQNRAHSFSIPLECFRILDTGLIPASAANGGVPASDTTPAFENIAAGDAARIKWAAGDVDPIQASFVIPAVLDTDENIQVHFLTGKSGDVDTVHMDGEIYQAEGDTNFFPAPSGQNLINETKTSIFAVCDAADLDSNEKNRNFTLVIYPEAHANDDIYLYGAFVKYYGKVL